MHHYSWLDSLIFVMGPPNQQLVLGRNDYLLLFPLNPPFPLFLCLLLQDLVCHLIHVVFFCFIFNVFTFIYLFFLWFGWMSMYMLQWAYRGQQTTCGKWFFISTMQTRNWHSGNQAQQQVPLPTEPYSRPQQSLCDDVSKVVLIFLEK